MKPICTGCRRFFRPKKNGVRFTEGMPINNGAEPGLSEPEAWRPYKLWVGDLWECLGCNAKIIVGCAGVPLSEHYMPDFKEIAAQTGADQLQINDC